MSYDASEPTPRDGIRGLAGDTSAPFWLEDATYDAVITKWGVPVSDWNSSSKFYRAAAELVRRVAVAIEQDITSFTATGEMSAGWGDKTRSLRELAKELDKKASEPDADTPALGGVLRVRNRFLTGTRGGDEW